MSTIRTFGNVLVFATLCLATLAYFVIGLLPRGSEQAPTSVSLTDPWPSTIQLGRPAYEESGPQSVIPLHPRKLYRLYRGATWIIETDSWSQKQILDQLPRVLSELKGLALRQPQPSWTQVRNSFDLDIRVKSPTANSTSIHVARVVSVDEQVLTTKPTSYIANQLLNAGDAGDQIKMANDVMRVVWTPELEWAGNRDLTISEVRATDPEDLVGITKEAEIAVDFVALSGATMHLTVTLFNPSDTNWADYLRLSVDSTELQALKFSVLAHQRASLQLTGSLPPGEADVHEIIVALGEKTSWRGQVLILPGSYTLKDHQRIYTDLTRSVTELEEAGTELHVESVIPSNTDPLIGFRSADCVCYLGLKALLGDLALPTGYIPEPPAFDIDVSPSALYVGTLATFSAQGAGRMRRVKPTLEWAFVGAGKTLQASGSTVIHVFDRIGSYKVQLRISAGDRTRLVEMEVSVEHMPTPLLGFGLSLTNPMPSVDLTSQILLSPDLLGMVNVGFGLRAGSKKDRLGNDVPFTYNMLYSTLAVQSRLLETLWAGIGGGIGLLNGQFKLAWQESRAGDFQLVMPLLRLSISWNAGPVLISVGFNYAVSLEGPR